MEREHSCKLAIRCALIACVLVLGACSGAKRLTIGLRVDQYFTDSSARKLAQAAAAGDVPLIRKLVKSGVPVDVEGNENVTPLIWAFAYRSTAGVKALLELGADPNHEDFDADSLVRASAEAREPTFLRLALRHGGDPNLLASNGYPSNPLTAAIQPGGLPCVKLLVAAGANVNYQDVDTGETPLISAADLNQYDIVYYLLQHGADASIKDKFGYTITYNLENNRYALGVNPNLDKFRQKVIVSLRKMGMVFTPYKSSEGEKRTRHP